MNCPSLVITLTSTVTSGTFTRNEKSSSPSGFLIFGVFSGGGVSSGFFLGTAMGPVSPCGPPASGFCCCCLVGGCAVLGVVDWPEDWVVDWVVGGFVDCVCDTANDVLSRTAAAVSQPARSLNHRMNKGVT